MSKRLLSGKVVSSNSDKTIVVEVMRRVKHKLAKLTTAVHQEQKAPPKVIEKVK